MAGEPDGTRLTPFPFARCANRAFQDELLIVKLRKKRLADDMEVGHADRIGRQFATGCAIGMHTQDSQRRARHILVWLTHDQQVATRRLNPDRCDRALRKT